jgi:hypothetical protein
MYAVVQRGKHYGLLFIVILLEAFVGVLGYFSKFKDVFQVLGIVLLSSPFVGRPRRVISIAALIVLVIMFGIVWSVVKGEYREFLNQGTGEQVELVPIPERVEKLKELVGALDGDAISQGIETLIIRVSYVQYFALSIINVPETVPYERGALWWGAVQHPFMPRLLFPNKPAIDDSERTAKYTGIKVAGIDEGTSIGIGYMGESYIDFGPRLMFVPVFLFGLSLGLIYRVFLLKSHHKLLGMTFASTVLMFGSIVMEQSNIKLIGGNLVLIIFLGGFLWLFGKGFWKAVSHW